MRYTKENIKDLDENIDNFSKIFGQSYNFKPDVLRNFVLANVAVAITRNSAMKKDINSVYMEDRYKYYIAAKESTGYNYIIITEGTLEQEIHAKKALGILLVAEEDKDVREKLIKLIRKYYPIEYKVVRTGRREALIKQYQNFNERDLKVEDRIHSLVYFYLAFYSVNKEIDVEIFEIIINGMNKFENSDPMTTNIEDELAMHKEQVQEIKSYIKKELGKINGFKDIIFNNNDDISTYGRIVKNLFVLNKMDIFDVFANYEYLNVEDIILAYIKKGYKKLEPELVQQTLYNGIYIKSLINEYKRARELYFQNCQETMFFEFNEIQEKLKLYEEKNKIMDVELQILRKEKQEFDNILNNRINKINKKNESELAKSNNKIKELEKQLEKEIQSKNELNALRETLFSIKNEYIPNESKKSVVDFIKGRKILVVGGSQEWRKKIKDKYPELLTMDGFNENFEISILNNVDFIFFYTGFMNHGTYYRVINYIRNKEINFGYIGKTNIELVENEMIEELEKI